MRLRRVMTALLAVAVTSETLITPAAVLASSDVVPQSSLISETDSEPSDVSVIESNTQDPEPDSEVSSILSEILGESSASVVPDAGEEEQKEEQKEEPKEEEKEETGPVLLEEKMLLASIDEEKKEIGLSFSEFADADKYVYEVCDKDGKVLKDGELKVEEKEIKGDLEEVFDEDKSYTASFSLDEEWPEELTLNVYDADKTSYITCSLQQKKAVDSVAAEANEEDKISVIWTEKKECDGYVVELLQEDGQLVDSATVEDTLSCTFKAAEENLSVQVTPYTQEEDQAPVYYIGAANMVMALSAAAPVAQTVEPTTPAPAPTPTPEPAPAPIIYPDKVAGVTAVAGDHEVKLTWAMANNAQAYNVYLRDPGNGAMQLLTTVTTPNCTVQNLKGDVAYWFVIEGVRTEDGQQYKGEQSAAVSATPYITVPKAPTGLSGTNSGTSTKLTWKANGIANGYIIYSYNYSKNKYVELARTTSTSYTDKTAGNIDKHKYLVKAYRTDDNVKFYISTSGPEVIVYGNKTVSAAKSVHPIYYSATITRKTGLYAKFRQDKTKQGSLKKGKKVTIVYRRWKQSLVSYNGKKYYVYNSAMRVTGQSYTKKDYTKQTKEYFINSNGYKSSSKYLIWISTYTQRINIFQGSKGKWTLIKSEQCVTGKRSTYTPLGNFSVTKKKKAHYYGKNFYKYLTYFRGDNKMHTRPARRSTGRYLDKRLGVPLSNGCVRLTDSLAKWVYNNVPKKATVLIY